MRDAASLTVLAGVNGAGKTTQLQIITGALDPDSGTISREKPDMKVAYLTQEFDVTPTNTVRVRSPQAILLEPGISCHVLKCTSSTCWLACLVACVQHLHQHCSPGAQSLRAGQ